jgi:hypothetical protein
MHLLNLGGGPELTAAMKKGIISLRTQAFFSFIFSSSASPLSQRYSFLKNDNYNN